MRNGRPKDQTSVVRNSQHNSQRGIPERVEGPYPCFSVGPPRVVAQCCLRLVDADDVGPHSRAVRIRRRPGRTNPLRYRMSRLSAIPVSRANSLAGSAVRKVRYTDFHARGDSQRFPAPPLGPDSHPFPPLRTGWIHFLVQVGFLPDAVEVDDSTQSLFVVHGAHLPALPAT